MSTNDTSIDGLRPETKEDFGKLEKAIAGKLSSLSASDHYTDFIESLVRVIKKFCRQFLSLSEIFWPQQMLVVTDPATRNHC